MQVSVIIPIYNGANILPVTIPPLINQDYPKEKMEIIIINDGSTDSTKQIINTYYANPIVTIISHSSNKGRAAARNSGLKVADGEIIIFLDCDIEVKPNFISEHVKYHKQKGVIGLLSNICTPKIKLNDKYQKYIFYGKRGAKMSGSKTPLPFKYFISGCTSVKMSAIKISGVFNENLPAYGEDLDFAYRLWKNFPKGLFYSGRINVYMYNAKLIDEALSELHQYGEYNVPIILTQYPELSSYVVADFVKSSDEKKTWKVLLGLLLINSFIFKLVKWLLLFTPFPFSNLLIRYLLAASVAMGYRRHLKFINNN